MTEIHPILAGKDKSATVGEPAFTYADLIVDYLSQIDVEYVYGIPGGAIEAYSMLCLVAVRAKFLSQLFIIIAHLSEKNLDHLMAPS